MLDKSIEMYKNIANKEDVVIDVIIVSFLGILLLMFLVSFGIFVYGIMF